MPVAKPFKRQNRYQTVRPLENPKIEIAEMVPIIPKKVKIQEVAPFKLEPKRLNFGSSNTDSLVSEKIEGISITNISVV